jgi:hypothetical protein
MRTDQPTLPDPLYMLMARKLVLLLLLMLTTVMVLVALLLKIPPSILWLAYVLAVVLIGLVAGFSVRWIIPRKFPVLRIGLIVTWVIGGLTLIRWFTGWDFGINFKGTAGTLLDWQETGQILLAIGMALLALYAWKRPDLGKGKGRQASGAKKKRPTQQKPKKQPEHAPGTRPAGPTPSLAASATSPEPAAGSVKTKQKRLKQDKPRLQLSPHEEHRCPYCLELITKDDQRGVVECEICHTLHHADCWAITGACQVPHFTT